MKKRTAGKFLSLMVTFVLLWGLFMPAVVQTEAAGDELAGVRLPAHYEFKNGREDSSGNGNDAELTSKVDTNTKGKPEYVIPKQSANVIRVPLAQDKEPDTEEPDREQPGTEQPDSGQPGTEQPGTGQPDTEQPSPSQPEEPVTIKLDAKKLTLGVEEKAKLKAKVTPDAASRNVTWTSSKPSVVKVTSGGNIQAKKTGKAVITASLADGKTASCTVTVKKAPKKITLKKKTKVLKLGKASKIKVKFPKNTWSNRLTYRSSKKEVVSVSANGVVIAKRKGKAVITVKTYNGKKVKMTVIVRW